MDLRDLGDDLLAERADLLAVLDGASPEQWLLDTPAVDWRVLDQVTHLAHFDDRATLAITDATRFRRELADQRARGESVSDVAAATHRDLTPTTADRWLREAGPGLVAAAMDAGNVRVPWYGPDMTVASLLTARIMETWAHGQDVVDALSVERAPTPRLRHIAFLGMRAFANSFTANGLDVPYAAVRAELTGPDGAPWVLGPDDADETVRGSALDFCLLVTRRRHRADTDVVADGAVADRWLDLAQAFAGPPGERRTPSGRS